MVDYAVRGDGRHIVTDDLTYAEQVAMTMDNAIVMDMTKVRNVFIGGQESRFEVIRPFLSSRWGRGWLADGAGSIPEPFPDRDGTQLAHDFIEHQNGVGGIGPLADEFEAIGARWFWRTTLDTNNLVGIMMEARGYGG